MKKGLMILGLLSVVFLVASVSAGVYFSQPEQTYNLGDVIINEVSVDPIESGFLKIDLICGGESLNVFNGVPIDGKARVEFPLTSAYIQNISGICHFLGTYSDDEKESREFKISKKLNVRLDIDSIFVKPGEGVFVSGTAERLNGVAVEGEVEVRVIGLSLVEVEEEVNQTEEVNETEEETEETEESPETFVEVYDGGAYFGRVIEGKFEVNFSLAKDTPANEYRIDVFVYEEDSEGKKTSEGFEIVNLKVSQVPTTIDIALGEQSVDPGVEFSFKPMLLDQTGQNIDEKVSVVIKDEDLTRIYERILVSGETVIYEISTNMTPGYYEIEVSSGDLSAIKKFYINEKPIITFELVNETLIVTNVGNIPYKKDIQVELNGKPFVKKVNLGLGEQGEFKLTGAGGSYDIKISDGESEFSQGGVVLTGNAIGVKEVREGVSGAFSSPIVWIFFIIVLGAGILFLFRNVFKKKSFAYPFKGKLKKGKEAKADKKTHEVKESKKHAPGALVAPNKAEQVLVLKGQKNKVAVLVLKIKNKISKVSKQSLEKAIEPVYKKRGAVYEQGDNIFIIFSPLMTRTFKNEIEAAKAAEKIVLILKEHNKKFKDKIEFGIAINSGHIVNKVEDKKLKFTALGNLISTAKRLASASNEQILVSKSAYKAGISEIKAEKKNIAHGEVYELRSVIDSAKNKKFLEGFLKRMGDQKY
jgi:hypothetical protein